MRRHIPNFITILNLLAGSAAVYFVLNGQVHPALYLILAAGFFDFTDGFAARLLKATTPIGKELDSLSDLVSFGLVPAAMVFVILKDITAATFPESSSWRSALPALALLIPAFSAVRLAIFNTRESKDTFQGMPTPAFAFFWTAIYFDLMIHGSMMGKEPGPGLIIALIVLFCAFMVIPLEMLSLKFVSFGWKGNQYRYIFLSVSAILLVIMGIPGLAFVILAYILVSLAKIVLT